MIRLCTLFIWTALLAQDVSLSTYVESKTVEDNKTFKFFLEFSWQGNASDYRINIQGIPTVYGLEVLGSGSSNKVSGTIEKPITTRRYFYNLKPTRLGDVSIETVRATATHVQTGTISQLSSQPTSLHVIKGKVPVTIDTKLILLSVGALLFIVGLIFWVLYRAKQKKKALEAFVSDDSFIEYTMLKQLTILKNEPERVDETAKTFFNLYESYLEEAHINKHSILLEPLSSDTHDSEAFKKRLDEIRFSGITPDVYELERLISSFKEVLTANLNTRKKTE